MFKLTTKKSKKISVENVGKVLKVMNILGEITKGGMNQLLEKGYYTADDGTHFTLRRIGGKPGHKEKSTNRLADNDSKDDQLGGVQKRAESSRELPGQDVLPSPIQTEDQSKS